MGQKCSTEDKSIYLIYVINDDIIKLEFSKYYIFIFPSYQLHLIRGGSVTAIMISYFEKARSKNIVNTYIYINNIL